MYIIAFETVPGDTRPVCFCTSPQLALVKSWFMFSQLFEYDLHRSLEIATKHGFSDWDRKVGIESGSGRIGFTDGVLYIIPIIQRPPFLPNFDAFARDLNREMIVLQRKESGYEESDYLTFFGIFIAIFVFIVAISIAVGIQPANNYDQEVYIKSNSKGCSQFKYRGDLFWRCPPEENIDSITEEIRNGKTVQYDLQPVIKN